MEACNCSSHRGTSRMHNTSTPAPASRPCPLASLQVNAVLDRHRPTFAHGGCTLSVQRVHGSYWVQVRQYRRSTIYGLLHPVVVVVGPCP